MQLVGISVSLFSYVKYSLSSSPNYCGALIAISFVLYVESAEFGLLRIAVKEQELKPHNESNDDCNYMRREEEQIRLGRHIITRGIDFRCLDCTNNGNFGWLSANTIGSSSL